MDQQANGEPSAIEGFTGLQNPFTYFLRQIRPTQVFVPTINDLHPDHKVTNEQLQISLFHSTGDIWPELGRRLTQFPRSMSWRSTAISPSHRRCVSRLTRQRLRNN